jgi:glycosyltransferase involved in cell wall biosynthesis
VASNRETALLFVDDGSRDRTPAILAEIAASDAARISVLTLTRNMGKAEAVRRGVQAAIDRQPEFVGFWDADLSTPLSAVQDFMDVFDAKPGIEIVMGARVSMLGRRIVRKAARHYVGRLFATAASVTLQLAVYDTQCGAKIFRVNNAVRQAFSAPFRSKWVMDVEILARYVACTGRMDAISRIYELPLREWTDIPGSKLQMRHAVRSLWDLAMIALRSRSGRR